VTGREWIAFGAAVLYPLRVRACLPRARGTVVMEMRVRAERESHVRNRNGWRAGKQKVLLVWTRPGKLSAVERTQPPGASDENPLGHRAV